ncbi:HrpF/NolX family T3SS translocon protein [Paraburkholderia xenovorans]|uniref:HrpF/NolX family T3SS translocon protein n=1 Tax=Paraburkholderia xenovorans TaxID=36873 RepID=UPI0038B76F75
MDTRITSPLQSGVASLKESLHDIGAELQQDHEKISSMLANIFDGAHAQTLNGSGAQPHLPLHEGEVLVPRQPANGAPTELPGNNGYIDPAAAERAIDAAGTPAAPDPAATAPASDASTPPASTSSTSSTATPTDPNPASGSTDNSTPPSEFANGLVNPDYVRFTEAQSAATTAAAASAAASASNPNELTDDQIATLSVLDRHQGVIKGSMTDLQKQIDDPNTPPDLKQALQSLKNDPDLQSMLDSASNGKHDGKFAPQDVTNLVKKHPEVQAYNEQQADAFEQNYIPSDNTDPNAQPREIDANDAMREFYRYSDNLPKNLSKQDLQNIVDGTGGEGKMPPQVVAAAKYFLDNPSAWQTIAGPSGKISRGHMEDAISSNVSLNDDENKTIATLQANEGTFFGGGNLTRNKLQQIANDPKSSPDVQQAAKQLLNDPMLFGMLDNGKHGNSGSFLHAADDGQIGKGDLDAWVKNSKTLGKPAPPTPPTHTPTAPVDVAAMQAMEAGEADQPDQKKEKGGGLQKFLQGLLHVLSKIADVFSTVLSALSKIPGIGEIFAGASIAAEAVSGQLEVGAVAVGGGSKADIENAEKDAALGLAGAAIGTVTVPGMGGAIVKGAEKGIEEGVDVAAKSGTSAIRDGVKDGVKDAAKDNVKDTVSSQVQQAVLPQQQQNQPVPA